MHFVQQVAVQAVAVLCQGDDSGGEGLDVEQVDGGDVLPHGSLGSFQNVLGLLFIPCHLLQVCRAGECNLRSVIAVLPVKL